MQRNTRKDFLQSARVELKQIVSLLLLTVQIIVFQLQFCCLETPAIVSNRNEIKWHVYDNSSRGDVYRSHNWIALLFHARFIVNQITGRLARKQVTDDGDETAVDLATRQMKHRVSNSLVPLLLSLCCDCLQQSSRRLYHQPPSVERRVFMESSLQHASIHLQIENPLLLAASYVLF